MDDDVQRQRDDIWQKLVFDEIKTASLAFDGPKEYLAIQLIKYYREQYESASDIGTYSGVYVHKAFQVWQLLSIDVAGWTVDVADGLRFSVPDDWGGDHRNALRAVMAYQTDGSILIHRKSFDQFPVMLPAWMSEALHNAVTALAYGEVHQIVQPVFSGRHNDAWSWDKLRLKAVEHVAYLRGQGTTKEIALARVSAATKIARGTLRDWESEFSKEFFSKETIARAVEAGRLKISIEDDPGVEEQIQHGVFDTLAYEALKDFRSEPLAQFGANYHERYGKRHNQAPTAGK